jgi:hypothetical protein
MRTSLLVVAMLSSVAPCGAAQTFPVKLTMLTAGFVCAQRPVADSDTVYVAIEHLPHNPEKPEAPQKVELRVPAPPGVEPGVPEPWAATTLRFYLDTTGLVDLCSAEVLAETSRNWTLTLASLLTTRHFTRAEKDGHPIRVLMTVQFIRHYSG